MVSFTVLVFTGMPLSYSDQGWAQWEMRQLGGAPDRRHHPPLRGHHHVSLASYCMLGFFARHPDQEARALLGPGHHGPQPQ